MAVSSSSYTLILVSLVIFFLTTTSAAASNDSFVNETTISSNSNMTTFDQDPLPSTQSTTTVTSTGTTTTPLATSPATTKPPPRTRGMMPTILGMLKSMDVLGMIRQYIAQDDLRYLLPKPESVNQRCYDEVVDSLDALIGVRESASSREYTTLPWALKMLDAMGKPPAGILRGVFQWMGNYRECMNVHAKIPNGTYLGSRQTARNRPSEFKAKYCRAFIYKPPPRATLHKDVDYTKWTAEAVLMTNWGLCLPESCGGSDVKSLLTEGTLGDFQLPVAFVECAERDYDLGSDGWAVFAVCLFSVVGAVVLFCTIVECAIFYGFLPWSQAGNENDSNTDKNSIENNGTKASTSNDRTPLSKPKDLFRDEETPHSRNEHLVDSPNRKATLAIKLLEAFSLRYNGKKIMATSTSSNPDLLMSIQGIRVIAMAWIILAHTYSVVVPNAHNMIYSYAYDGKELFSRLSFAIVGAGNLAVDTFFVISGLLVMKITLRELRKGKGQNIKFWVKFYLHRFWRLTPVYMMVLMTGTTLYDFLVEGPLKTNTSYMFGKCDSKWWSNLIYINNFYKTEDNCMTWTWYIAVDMQLFWISPIFILLIHRKYRLGLFALVATVVLGSLTSFLLVLDNPGILPTAIITANLDYVKHVYIVPWIRIVAFAVGMLVAVILEDACDKKYFSKLKAFFIWVFLTGALVFIILIAHQEMDNMGGHWEKGTMALYETSSRLIWSIYIAWVIYACQNGLGGIATDFLTWTGFQPMAKLTYTAYLVHPMVIVFFMYSRNATFDLQDSVMIYLFSGNMVVSYLVAALYTLLFESPLLTLEKIVLGRT